jgi:DNA-binding TFAR19-related protein (PDSD5 family)
MADERELEELRREARALLRAASAGDSAAHGRATAVLGARADARFVLADALHVVARERGARSWPELVARERGARSWPDLVARARRGRIASALDEALDEHGGAEIEVETDLAYPDGSPVVVAVRQRQRRYMLDDRGEAVRRAGRPPGWQETAERAVRRSGMNVSATTGVVFVPTVAGKGLDDLAWRLARGSLDVLEALLEGD